MALKNLIDNALKYSLNPPIKIEVDENRDKSNKQREKTFKRA